MFNTLMGDPVLRGNVQFWFFRYSSGNPILYSAATLREALRDMIARVDPDGTDPALRQMVLIGHSQGGLIVKLMVVDGSMDWLDESIGQDVDALGLTADQSALLQRAYEFDPLSFVTSVVFLATPHRGSFRADSWYSRLIAKLIAVPGEIQGVATRLTTGAGDRLPQELVGRIPTSLDNMNPGSPILGILARSAIAPWVTSHSIIAVGDADTSDPAALAEADDGVVRYPSAHLDGVASECLVHASHSCQDDPTVIQEVRRILLEHLAAISAVPTAPPVHAVQAGAARSGSADSR
jgi:hypothetical protein